MEIRLVEQNKKEYLPLLLLADPEEEQIDSYLCCGSLFALYDDNLKTVAVVTDEGDGCCELKNLATAEPEQHQGYAQRMIAYLTDYFRPYFGTMLVGTGRPMVPFYQACGFQEFGVKKNFFLSHYQKPIFEEGKQLVDMIMLRKPLQGEVAMQTLTDLPNIGKAVAEQLFQVGVASVAQLKQIGAKEAWLRIQAFDPSACYNQLCALEGAIQNVRWHNLSPACKQELKEFYLAHLIHLEEEA